MTTNFFSPLFYCCRGMGKNQDPGSGINIPDPQHWSEVWDPDHSTFKQKSLEKPGFLLFCVFFLTLSLKMM
jgi:hypothetical protein